MTESASSTSSLYLSMANPTTWCARTSKDSSRLDMDSSSCVKAFRAITAASNISSSFTAKMTPLDTSPCLCPDLPARWISRETCRGDMYCMTKSTLPTSIPSSMELVQMMDFNSWALNFSSVSILMNLDSDEWWTSMFSSIILNREERTSAISLVFTKTRTLWWSSSNCCILLMRAAVSKLTCNWEAKSMSSSNGYSTFTTKSFSSVASTISTFLPK